MSNQQTDVLFAAAGDGDYTLIQSILEKEEGIDVNIHESADEDRTMLHMACWCRKHGGDYLQIVELLLAHGGDVNSIDNYGTTPLHQACGPRKNLEIVKFLSKKEINIILLGYLHNV